MSPLHFPLGVHVASAPPGGPPALLVLPPPPPPPTMMQHSWVAPSHDAAPHAIAVVGFGDVGPPTGPEVGEPLGTLPVVPPAPLPALLVGEGPGPATAVTAPSSRIFPPQAAATASVVQDMPIESTRASIEERVITCCLTPGPARPLSPSRRGRARENRAGQRK
ncbi:MAG: hypothetical protein QOI41_7245 [Myxococcales bacterium]|nr:hypothetical protein [Myxococcales bacterium]